MGVVGGRAALGEALDTALRSLARLFVALDTGRQGVLVPAKVLAALACEDSSACEAVRGRNKLFLGLLGARTDCLLCTADSTGAQSTGNRLH